MKLPLPHSFTLNREVAIQNHRLASLYYVLLVFPGISLIWIFFAYDESTLVIPYHTIARFSISPSYKAAAAYDPSSDRMCAQTPNFQADQEVNISGPQWIHFGCTTFTRHHLCPINASARRCLYASEVVSRTDFGETIRIAQVDKVVQRTSDLQSHLTEDLTYNFNPFVQALAVQVKYQFIAQGNIPTFWRFNKDLPKSGTNVHARTVLLNANGMPERIFEAGEEIMIPLPQLLQVMIKKPITATTYRAKDKNLESYFPLFSGDDKAFPSWIWDRGAKLNAQVKCASSDGDIREVAESVASSTGNTVDDSVWDFGASQSTPVCLLYIDLLFLNGRSFTVTEKKLGLMAQRMYVDIHLMSLGGTSFLRAHDLLTSMLFITSAWVMVGLPKQFMRFFTLNCLGLMSRIYKNAVAPIFHIQDHCITAVMQLVSQSVSFVELADQKSHDGVEHGGISRCRMRERVSAISRHRRADLDESEARVLADFAFKSVMTGVPEQLSEVSSGANSTDDAPAIIDINNFCHRTGSEEISIDTMAYLFHRDRRPHPLERLFFPQSLWKRVHQNSHDAGSGAVIGAQQQQSLKLDDVEKELSVKPLPLESRKSLVSQAVNALVCQNCKQASVSVAGLEAEVKKISEDLTALSLHVEKLESERLRQKDLTGLHLYVKGLESKLLRETEQRIANEAELRRTLTSGMDELQSLAKDVSTAEAKRHQVASAVGELCSQSELKLREDVAKIEMEVTGIMQSAKEAGRELQENISIMQQEFHKAATATLPTAAIEGTTGKMQQAHPAPQSLRAKQSPNCVAGNFRASSRSSHPLEPALEVRVDGLHDRFCSVPVESAGRAANGHSWRHYI